MTPEEPEPRIVVSPDEPVVHVTLVDIYRKVGSLEEKVNELNVNASLMIQQRADDRKLLDKLENATDWLKRTVYAVGVPIVLLLSGIEAVSRLWQL